MIWPPVTSWLEEDSISWRYEVRITDAGVKALQPKQPVASRFTPKEVAEMLGIDVEGVYAAIQRGDLKTVNVSRTPDGSKPRYMIPRESLEQFQQARTVHPPQSVRRQRKPPMPGVKPFFT